MNTPGSWSIQNRLINRSATKIPTTLFSENARIMKRPISACGCEVMVDFIPTSLHNTHKMTKVSNPTSWVKKSVLRSIKYTKEAIHGNQIHVIKILNQDKEDVMCERLDSTEPLRCPKHVKFSGLQCLCLLLGTFKLPSKSSLDHWYWNSIWAVGTQTNLTCEKLIRKDKNRLPYPRKFGITWRLADGTYQLI